MDSRLAGAAILFLAAATSLIAAAGGSPLFYVAALAFAVSGGTMLYERRRLGQP